MSGDVQPRKRRDKKKKKDDFEDLTAHHFHARAPTPPSSNDEVIHVYKENSTGGGICAKIVFFILLSILAVLIGLIITEHRGLTDLDTLETETRFSQIFEGWIDKTPESHDDDAHHAIEHDDHDEHDDDHDDDHDEEHDDEEEEHASEEEEEEEEEHASEEVEEDDKEDSAVDEEEDEEEQSTQQDDDEEEEEEEEAAASEEAEEPSAQQDDDDDEEDKDEEDEKSTAASEEAHDDDNDDDEEDVAKSEDDDEQGGNVDDDDDDDNQDEDDDNETTADSKAADDEDDRSAQAASEEKDDDDDDGDDDDEKAPKSQKKKDEDEENLEADDEDQAGEEADNNDETNTGVVIKIGVGVTIMVVAYVVLVRKWKSDDNNQDDKAEKKEIPVDLSRRNTIVVPPKVEEVEQVIDNDDEEYSEEEEEEIKLHPRVKQDYQQLRSTYERSLTPESDQDIQERSYDYDDEGEEDVEYDDEEGEYEENLADEEEEEEEPEEEEPISDPDDDDLLKKIEAKYGKLETSHADDEDEPEEEEEEEEPVEEDVHDFRWKRSTGGEQAQPGVDEFSVFETPAPYEYESLTNDEDMAIKDQLDGAHEHIETNAALAVSLFNNILQEHPTSPRATYGKAKSLDNLADKRRSNELLKEAITTYSNLLKLSNVPSALFAMAGERCVNRMRFIGQYGRAAAVHNVLISRFPEEISYRNQLAVTYLMSNRVAEARKVLQQTLQKWPKDGFALVHYGFILKVNDNKLKESVEYLKRGLDSKAEGVVDGRFYFHLGDAYIRLGKKEEASKVYNEGVKNNVFLSVYQRSLYNVNRLKGKPWWEKTDIPQYKNFFNLLEKNYLSIKKEGLALLNEKGYFQDEAENLRDVGEWKQFELYARGMKKVEHCKKCPITCKLVESLNDATSCRRGQIKFSVMHPGTHVWPHCGPTNCRLRVHLGLKVPKNTFIRVAEDTRSWEEGKVLIFDDSFEHEVWHNGSETRLVLIVDVWHPELTKIEKQSLSAI